MKEAAKASQRVGTTLWQGQRGKEATPTPLSLPSLCKMYMPPFPASTHFALGVGGSCGTGLWAVQVLSTEARAHSLKAMSSCNPWQHEHTTWSHNLLHSEF